MLDSRLDGMFDGISDERFEGLVDSMLYDNAYSLLEGATNRILDGNWDGANNVLIDNHIARLVVC